MSALSYICEYGSHSEESDNEIHPEPKRVKLHVPDLSGIPIIPREVHIDDPQFHGGRKRSFPHVRGNWASFVYVKYPIDENISKLINKLQIKVSAIDDSCQKCEDIHISLSKTFVLQYHLINSFSTSLQEAICGFQRFYLNIDSVKVYCNEESTRTFVALEVTHHSAKYLENITQKIDEVLSDYKFDKFYKDPSFHVSILWINGNKKKELISVLDDLNNILQRGLHQIDGIGCIDKVYCKIGNKYFQYSLQ